MSLLQIAKCLVVLNQTIVLKQVLSSSSMLSWNCWLERSENLRCRVEFDAASGTFLVSFQDHIAHDFKLCHAFKLELCLKVFGSTLSKCEVVALSISTSKVDLLVFVSTSLDSGSHSLNDNCVLGAWLHF